MTGASTKSQSAKLAEEACKAMALHDIVPTPNNYTVWYSYAAGTMQPLRQSIDALIAKQTVFTEEINEELYKRYFGAAGEHVDVLETGGRLQAVIDQVSRYLDDHSGQVDDFCHHLNDISSAIGRSQPLDPASPAAAMVAEIARQIESGLEPAAVAARVLDAIRHDELYIFTHPDMRAEVEPRFAAILAALDKVPGQ